MPYKYWAFISYSHADERWGRWLHSALESYRVPRPLVGRPLHGETIPPRLLPVFRDRDELPSSHELGAVINRALQSSRNLIVICSPQAAASRWVDEEVRAFRALGRASRVFCLIVDGEPPACFPAALREDAAHEPIAADARKGKDGPADAKLKLIAGLFDLDLDDLKQRERRRQFWQRARIAAAAVVVALALQATYAWQKALRAQQAESFRIATLLERGRFELDANHKARAAVYLAAAAAALPAGDPREAALRFRLARAMESVDLAAGSASVGRNDIDFAAVTADGSRLLTSSRSGFGVAETQRLKLVSLMQPPSNDSFQISPPVLSPDGRWAARIVRDIEHVGVWEIETGRRVLEQPAPGAQAVAFLNGGDAIAVGGSGGVLIVPLTGRSRRLAAQPATQIAPLGSLLAIGSAAGTVELWAPPTGRRTAAFHGLRGAVTCLASSPDGRQLLAGSDTGELRLWRVADGEGRAAGGHRSAVRTVQWSADGKRYLSIGAAAAQVWDAADGRLLMQVDDASAEGVTQTRLSADGRRLLRLDAEGLAVWSVDAAKVLHLLDGHAGRATAMAESARDGRIYLVGADARITVWNPPGAAAAVVAHAGAGVLTASFDPSEQRVLTAGLDGRVRTWRASDGAPLEGWRAHGAGATAAEFLDESRVLSGGADGSLTLHALAGGHDWRRAGAHAQPVTRIEHPPGSDLVVTRDRDGDARAWRLDGAAGLRPALPDPQPRHVSVAPDQRSLIAVTPDGHVEWIEPDGSVRWRGCLGPAGGDAPCPVPARIVRTLGASIIAAADAFSRYLDPATGAPGTTGAPDALAEVLSDVSGTPARYLVCESIGTARLIGPDGRDSVELVGEKRQLRSCAGPAAGVAYTGGDQGLVMAWDAATGERIANVAQHGDAIASLRVNRAGDRLLTASLDGTAAIWNVGAEARPLDEIQHRLECFAPWTLEDDRLVVARERGSNTVSLRQGIARARERTGSEDCAPRPS